METIKEPYLRDIQDRGFIEGLTIKEKSSERPVCHYFGGLPYALPPVGPFRWQRPRPLPTCYTYGTRNNPGRFTGETGKCPQLAVDEIASDAAAVEEFLDHNAAGNQTEDCLQCNIWIPYGDPPSKGWPVYFYIHGGFLQIGSANEANFTAMYGETPFRAIIVMPAYRLNVFGFLASPDMCSESTSPEQTPYNLGFWDQRLALEWTHKLIKYFDGNASNITVGGYSAGAHSAFYQLQYDLFLPTSKSIIKRVVTHSNGPGMQPKSLIAGHTQFLELLDVLSIPRSLSSADRMARLRVIPARKLLVATKKMRYHQYRAMTDNDFVKPDLFESIDSGRFAARMRARNIRLLIGECRDEHFLYATWHPAKNSLKGVYERLQADYPKIACKALLNLYYPNGKLPAGCKDWPEAFGHIYADMQIHMIQRGVMAGLARAGIEDLIYRYRIEWRADCAWAPPEWGVTHGTDGSIWFWGDGDKLRPEEKKIVKDGLHDLYCRFIHGEDVRREWGTDGIKRVRRLRPDGKIDAWEDTLWDRAQEVWRVLQMVGVAEEDEVMKLSSKLDITTIGGYSVDTALSSILPYSVDARFLLCVFTSLRALHSASIVRILLMVRSNSHEECTK
ncbi:alpha/beta-hydrolase [Patellaria atrata CBS 101060]|uniref:Alpha/beta-hydrolase n=1 Tax=Patellaria atrata CBS 101060 TaxID=1346257 RepID=A0A9P4VNS5_9PEZI|nr:alpha/beta-hydrolase [Patellaria atrata CBS 101060]